METRLAPVQAIAQTLRRAALPALCLLAIAYFVGHAVSGPAGLFAWKDYARQQAQLTADLAAKREARTALERQVQSVDPRHVDRDMAEVLVRKNLNVVGPDEVIVPLPPEAGTNAPPEAGSGAEGTAKAP